MTKIQVTEMAPSPRTSVGWAFLIFCWVMLQAAALSAGTLEPAVFIPQWLPQAQFVGYYVAYEKGFYRRLGLDLRILPGGPGRPASEWLERGLADFGSLMLAQAVKKRAEGVRLVHIGQVVQQSALLLVAKKRPGNPDSPRPSGEKGRALGK